MGRKNDNAGELRDTSLADFQALSEQILTAKLHTVAMRKAGRWSCGALPARFENALTAKERKAQRLLREIGSPTLRVMSERLWGLAGVWAGDDDLYSHIALEHDRRIEALRKQQQALLNALGSTLNTPPG